MNLDNAKSLAKRMLRSMGIDDDGFVLYAANGAIDLSVSLYYLGYEFIDTDNRHLNEDDHYRIALLIKSGVSFRGTIEKIVKIVVNDFIANVDINRVKDAGLKFSGELLGKISFSEITGISLGRAVSTSLIGSVMAGGAIGITLLVGAESARAIYTSRNLKNRNINLYSKLRRAGNIDLLYFAIEEKINPFEDACLLSGRSRAGFNNMCDYFFGGI